MDMSPLLDILEKYILALISIICCILGFWMGRRTKGVESKPSKHFDWRRYIKKDAQPEPSTDLLNDALGNDSDYDNSERIPTLVGDRRL
jgi:hypothetical protein